MEERFWQAIRSTGLYIPKGSAGLADLSVARVADSAIFMAGYAGRLPRAFAIHPRFESAREDLK